MRSPRKLGLIVMPLAIFQLLAAIDGRGQTVSTVSAATVQDASIIKTHVSSGTTKSESTETARIGAMEETLRQQGAQLAELRKLLVEQQETIKLLAGKLGAGPATSHEAVAANAGATGEVISTPVAAEPQLPSTDDRLKGLETRVAEIGPVKFSGDLRVRSESFFGLTNSLASAINPSVFGNDLSYRHRMRYRARLSIRGTIGQQFDWGLRLATGGFADTISSNQTMTDFFNHKPFALDQAFITYKPKSVPGLRIQGGKFEPSWAYTELTFDNEVQFEGLNESYTRTFKKSAVKEVSFLAWQLPTFERTSAFVRNLDGTINLDQSRRDGRDLALFGGQVRTRIEPNSKVALSLSIADFYFAGTQNISPIQVFGNQLLLPVTFTIPATSTTPAQVVTTQVSIPRDLLVAGNANLGISTASNNAINRDGRLASGFNLVDLIARLELKYSKRFPVTILLDLVTNTQTHDVVRAGPGGVDQILPNHENQGFWGEVQVGHTREAGGFSFGYTFMRIEKDAVLTPFNFSDVTQQSDMRAHRFAFAYAVDPRVIFSVTGIFTQRANGLFGPFQPTPLGSLDRTTKRLQIDTTFRF